MASDAAEQMVVRPAVLPTADVELTRIQVTSEQLERFLQASSTGTPAEHSPPPSKAPLSFAFALRRGHGPDLEMSSNAFSIHGGHDIELLGSIRVGTEYSIVGRVDEVFEKTGRSGPLTVIGRSVRIDDPHGTTVATVRDRQIVRWKPTAPASARAAAPGTPTAVPPTVEIEDESSLEIGSTVGPVMCDGPSASAISSWASALRDRETLFHDPAGSRNLGFADLVVPGPMQSAFVDDMLRSQLPSWRLAQLSMTFRQSLIAGDAMAMHAVVIDARESDPQQRTCDIVIENAATGETTSTGVARLTARTD